MARPPAGLESAGRRLWRAVTSDYELTGAEREILLLACRTADVCTLLEAECATDADGSPTRALVELRQQRMALTRFLVALRLPDEESQRPQYRGPRGVYPVRTA